MTSNGPSPTGISRSRFTVSMRAQYRAPACASAGSASIAVTRHPSSVSRRLRRPSAAPTSSSFRPRLSPSHRRITEWLLCGSGLRTYLGDGTLITPSSDVRGSIAKFEWLGHLHERVGREALQELGQGTLEVAPLAGFERHLHLVLGIGELRIRAEQQQRVVREQPVEVVGEHALADGDEDVLQMDRLIAEPLADGLEFLAKDLGHAGQHVDVAHEDRRKPNRLA